MRTLKFKAGRFRMFFEPLWHRRPHPYWFNTKYPSGWRRICIPFFTVDVQGKGKSW